MEGVGLGWVNDTKESRPRKMGGRINVISKKSVENECLATKIETLLVGGTVIKTFAPL